jgi:ParB-like chromosome segregation protein Spo0J
MGNLLSETIANQTRALCATIAALPEAEAVEALNSVRQALHAISPFRDEPVDCVIWVPGEQVEGNAYNPNTVAPPEMRLLELSIKADGYTQPIVAHPEGTGYEVVDGFHRHRVGKESKVVRQRVHNYLPLTLIRADREGYADRVAATIRHNRARGKHRVQGMSEIVQDLARRNHSDEWIARELGMDADEVLRLKQISGLAEMFADREFSEAWEVAAPDASDISDDPLLDPLDDESADEVE